MVSRIGSFDEIVNLGEFLKQDLKKLTETDLRQAHAATARRLKADALAAADAKPVVTTIVDGRRGAAEETVKAFGVIAYQFRYWEEIVAMALEMAKQLSPKDSGQYAASWFVLADGLLVKPDAIPAEAVEISVTNDQPYHRVIEVGREGQKFRVGLHIAERVTMAVNRRFGNFTRAQTKYLQLSESGSGRAPEVPWVIRNPRSRKARDAVVTYPAIVMRGI